jgi:adenylate cyclase
MEAFLLGDSPSLTRVEVAERAGVPLEVAEVLWRQLGFPHRTDDDVAFAPSDVEALRLAADLMRQGVLSDDSTAALVRTWGRSYARLAEWQTTLLAGLAVDGDDDPADPEVRLAELATSVLPTVDALQGYVWRRHLASAANRLLTREEPLGEHQATMAVCFVDIVGYTARSRALDEHDLVAWVERFEQEATGTVVDHGGRVIKTIGDEVLFTADDPGAAVRVALALAARGADDEDPFPAVRAGIAHGVVVRRLGDVFGSTVNAAARLTSLARPGSVVVDAGVHDALADDEALEVRWRRLRRVSVKGFTHLEAWRVRPTGEVADLLDDPTAGGAGRPPAGPAA